MPDLDPAQQREFAIEVVRRLREAGFQALWAGGCVRDQALGRTPKDYDVATDARPEQVQTVFGRRRTRAIGAAFGVISVLGPRGAGVIEVATFRQDAGYSDGRRPDHVTFSTPEEDARRRDFTINGLFFDPLAGRVLDFVGGEADLARGVVRAIGDPHARIAEDKLRMLRAVRFAAAFGFELEAETRAAIRERAGEILIVSGERIGGELRRMLEHPARARAAELLRETGLLAVLLPEGNPHFGRWEEPAPPGWLRTTDLLARLPAPSFAAAWAGLLRELVREAPAARAAPLAAEVSRRWRLTNDDRAAAVRLLEREPLVRRADAEPWPRVQRVLAAEGADELLSFAEAATAVEGGGAAGLAFCRAKLALPAEVWNPPPLVTGDDLRGAGLTPGPDFRRLLEAVRDAQLEGRIATRDDGLALVRGMRAGPTPTPPAS